MKKLRFNRQELAGSLGDLGTLLPLGVGLIQINGLNGTAVLLSVGLFYILSGLYFGIPVPVQPMKIIGAYAIAKMLTPEQISSAGMWMGIGLLLLAATGAITVIGRIVPRPVIRGVQLTTGIMLLSQGVHFIIGNSQIQKLHAVAEPYLTVQSIGPVPIGIILGTISILTIFLFVENKRFPASIIIITAGAIVGLASGGLQNLLTLKLGFHLPGMLPFGLPGTEDIIIGLTVLALPQMPMTVGNAIIAQTDLTEEYFGPENTKRATITAFSISMALANIACSLIGAMPLCHGAGGLAAHYRFGARTAGSNLMIGLIFIVIALFLGDQAKLILSLLPFSMLGALLVFAGAQLAMMVMDVKKRKDFFVVLMICGTALASNLAAGFMAGILLSYLLRSRKFKV